MLWNWWNCLETSYNDQLLLLAEALVWVVSSLCSFLLGFYPYFSIKYVITAPPYSEVLRWELAFWRQYLNSTREGSIYFENVFFLVAKAILFSRLLNWILHMFLSSVVYVRRQHVCQTVWDFHSLISLSFFKVSWIGETVIFDTLNSLKQCSYLSLFNSSGPLQYVLSSGHDLVTG